MVRTQIYFTMSGTMGIQLHVSDLYIGLLYILASTLSRNYTNIQPDDGQYRGPKHVVVYPMYYSL